MRKVQKTATCLSVAILVLGAFRFFSNGNLIWKKGKNLKAILAMHMDPSFISWISHSIYAPIWLHSKCSTFCLVSLWKTNWLKNHYVCDILSPKNSKKRQSTLLIEFHIIPQPVLKPQTYIARSSRKNLVQGSSGWWVMSDLVSKKVEREALFELHWIVGFNRLNACR